MTVFVFNPKAASLTTMPAVAQINAASSTEAPGSTEPSTNPTASDTNEATTPAPVNTVVSNDVGLGKVAPEQKLVKIDGPVSQIFTDALNKLLVQESYMSALSGNIPKASPVEQEDSDEVEPDVLVLCWRADALNAKDLVHLSNLVTRETERNFIIAVESVNGKCSSAAGLLPEFEKFPNVKVAYSLRSGAQALLSMML